MYELGHGRADDPRPMDGCGAGVMNEVQLWRDAAALLNAHGDAAQAEALRRADAALDSGDVDGFNRWKRVARLIVEMQSQEPDGEVH